MWQSESNKIQLTETTAKNAQDLQVAADIQY